MADIHKLNPGLKTIKDPVRRIKEKYVDFKIFKIEDGVKSVTNKIISDEKNILHIVEEFYKYGVSTLSERHNNEFINATTFFSTILNNFGNKAEYFANIFNSDIDTLNDEEKFQKTLMCFLVNPDDRLNYRNLKYYLESLSCLDNEDRFSFKNLYDYIDFIIDALMDSLYNGEYKIKMDFFYLATSFKEETNEIDD